MSTKDIPVPLADILERIATPGKPVSAWEDELKRKASDGEFSFLYLDGKNRGKRYLTERMLSDYLSTAYRSRNDCTQHAIREALNARR